MISSVMPLLMEQEEPSQVHMAMPAALKALTALMDLMEPADSMEEPTVQRMVTDIRNSILKVET